MGKQVDRYIFNEWFQYFIKNIEYDFKIPSDKLFNNYLLSNKQDALNIKEAAINDLRKELGMPYELNKTSDALDPLPSLTNGQHLKEYVYLETYLDTKDFLFNEVKTSLGLPIKNPISLRKKAFLKGLEDLLSKTDPDFLFNLRDYLANSEYLLNDLKKYLGISDEDNTFDSELSILCKSGYARLFEMLSSDKIKSGGLQNYLYQNIFEGGVPYFGNMLEVGKEWLYLYVKLSFDPPTASTLTYLKERLNELEWYIVNYNLGDLIYGEQKHAGDKTSWD